MSAAQSRPAHTSRLLRIAIPLIFIGLGSGVVLAMLFRTPPRTPQDLVLEQQQAEKALEALEADAGAKAGAKALDGAAVDDPPAVASEVVADDDHDDDADDAADTVGTPVAIEGLRARAPQRGRSGADVTPAMIGSLDPQQTTMQIEFSLAGAGMQRMVMSNQWQTWQSGRQAAAHHEAVQNNEADVPAMPSDEQRYVLNSAREYPVLSPRTNANVIVSVPVLSMLSVEINGEDVSAFHYTWDDNDTPGDTTDDTQVFVWAETAPGRFETEIVNSAGDVIADVMREFTLGHNGDITLTQRLVNRTDQLLDVRWKQYGPSELDTDRSKYLDRRRLRFGYQLARDPQYPRSYIYGDDEGVIERESLVKDLGKLAERERDERQPKTPSMQLWPDPDPEEAAERGLVWYASTNRYFTLAVHPPLVNPTDSTVPLLLNDQVEQIHASIPLSSQRTLFTYLFSPVKQVEPGGVADFSLGVYGGPLDRDLLSEVEPYRTLNMQELILFLMSTCCAVCTFPWLADLLLTFLSFLHDYVVFDWAVAIIILVVIVRTMLHPLVKKGQIAMQRMGKAMQSMKPEIEKLQKKYAGDPKRMQQEQMRLWREHNVSPVGCLGILPMFLQMPIWVALYAMLYFTYELRQEPAFYGFFQLFNDWAFLADMSASDHFFWEFSDPHQFLFWNITGINLLPILMGFMFYVQQKYMTPPPSASMTPEQEQMQKTMRIVFPLMMPLMLYSAPSGLTLYILTSSLIGMLEARYIRAHIRESDLKKPDEDKPVKPKPKKPRGMLARAQARAMEAAEERRRNKARGPQTRYKKRK